MKLSLIVPCYNEAETVSLFQAAVIDTFQNSCYDFEIVYIDDGSTDATLHNLKKLHNGNTCKTKIISFTRNFGKDAGIYAGLQHATGDYICVIDADLQQHPSIALQMVDFLESHGEFDVVAAYQDNRKEGKGLSFFKKAFYSLINKLSDIAMRPDASDFRTFRKSVAESILSVKEYHRFSKGIFAWVGYNTHYMPYTVNQRVAGKTKWNFRKLFNYGIDGVVGYSTKPLRIATFLGGITSFAAILYLIMVVLEKLITGIDIPGYATIIVLILFLGSMQLFCIGIIGEYVGRTFEQSKERPIYIAKEIIKDE